MADPFSIAANAISVLSLGISVCQSLINYCQAYVRQHDDICFLLQDLQDLEKTLTSLHQRLPLLALHRPDLFDLMSSHIGSLKGRIDELQPILNKMAKLHSGGASFKGKIQSAKERTLYPFKKGGITEMRDTVRKAQENLTLALSVVHL
jgi:hypothetical protein